VDSIYHYCSLDTFYKIVSRKSIRLSDLNKTNDYMEKRWILKVLPKALVTEFIDRKINIDLWEKYWYEDGVESHMAYLNAFMKETVYSSSPILISCFSKVGDKLSQWRAYGDDGYGVSIGFNYKKLKKLKSKSRNLDIKNVIYKDTKQIQEIRKYIYSTIQYMEGLFEDDLFKQTDNFNEYFTEEFTAFCEVLVDYMEYVSCYFKNPAFIEEEEVRIIYSPPINTDFSDEDLKPYFNEPVKVGKYRLDPIRYYTKNKQLVAYTDVYFDELVAEDIISEIVLGPKSKLTKADVFFFLVSNDFNPDEIKISKSKATYR